MKTYKVIGLTALVCIIATATLFYAFGATSIGTTFYISSGIYPGSPTYTVWKSGSTYYAKDQNGQIDYQSSNGSYVIQQCVDVCDVDDSIYLRGELTFTHTVIVEQTRLKIFGDCLIIYSGSGACFLFNGSNSQLLYNEISDLHIRLDSDSTVGIHIYNQAYYFDLINLYIFSGSQKANSIGVLLEGAVNGVYWNTITGLRTFHIGTGALLNGTAENPNSNEFYYPIIRQSSLCGINISEGVSTRVVGGRIENTYDNSIGVWVNGSYATFLGLAFELQGSGTHAYSITSSATRTEIYGGRLNVAGQHIVDAGTNTHIYHSAYQNSGSAEASNDDWIAHGLNNLDPTVVFLTVNETDARYIIQLKATNTTHFQIYLYDETGGVLETVDKTILWHASCTNP